MSSSRDFLAFQIAYDKVVGGLLHKMWHIQKQSGEYTVKELNPHTMTRKNIVEEYERSERIAHAFKDKGIPCAVSLLQQNTSVIVIDGQHFIVYLMPQTNSVLDIAGEGPAIKISDLTFPKFIALSGIRLLAKS